MRKYIILLCLLSMGALGYGSNNNTGDFRTTHERKAIKNETPSGLTWYDCSKDGKGCKFDDGVGDPPIPNGGGAP